MHQGLRTNTPDFLTFSRIAWFLLLYSVFLMPPW
jgi:hypothetical protein